MKFIKLTICTLIFLVSLGFVNRVYAASYTVCDTGNGCDYTTIAAAINAVTTGTANTITVNSPYSGNERVTVDKAGASDANRLVIQAGTGFTQESTYPMTKGFIVTGNYVTVKGFEVTACGVDTICMVTSADYTTFSYNKVHGTSESNDEIDEYEMGTDDPGTDTYHNYFVAQFNNIYLTGNTGKRLINFRSNNATIEGNELHNAVDGDGIWFWGDDITIKNNYIHDITYGNGVNHSDGMQTFGDGGYTVAKNVVIENNLMISTGDDLQPMNMSYDGSANITDITIRNNIIMNYGTQINTGVPNTSFYNNVFINVGEINSQNINNLYDVGGANGWNDTGLIIKNNIFIYTYESVAEDNQYAMCTLDGRATHTNNLVARHTGGSYSADTPWPSETGGINGSNPLFTSWNGSTLTCGTATRGATSWSCSNFDLSIATNSPAKDAGADLSATWANATDRIGTSRPQNSVWDIGAYEYTSGSSDTVAPASPTGLSVS